MMKILVDDSTRWQKPSKKSKSRTLLTVLFLVAVAGCVTLKYSKTDDDKPSGWPVELKVAKISSRFGARRGGSRHQGIDLSAAKGTTVVATANGRVVFAGRSDAYGKTIIIDHGDGWTTHYAHLKRIKVGKANRVRRGEKIGTVGKSGNATGYHLHYEVHHHNVPVDPWPLMNHR